jgi:hypothetical protein
MPSETWILTSVLFCSYSVNATVIGSKPKSSKGKADEQEEVAEHDDQETKEDS